ncbi:DNA polymerase III subunit delta' [Fervidibacillus halotolerans]|uniref:DNA polymerase III subunit delta' n=1 Tax=Fervidibacillus halotolerans TaxID=2980027 RepID=A0A9E8M107_9BACI|nr:DNA polymerase III subunit delta' [Fervidibacillus halotolerans]WAA12324.1 DNA polymerase III subunit delta' [Fervidibacillus halotolerans]
MKDSLEQLEIIQPLVMKRLKQALIKKRVSHAYLFEGLKGTGKKDVAKFFAKSLFCEQVIDGYKPCNQCIQCQRIESGNHPDVHVIEPDGASIKKDQILYLQQEFSKKGMESNHKFYMIVDADKMTGKAANSLLKFLEEPNAQTTAVLITERVQKILPTIYSRCQHVPFSPLPKKKLEQQLIEKGIKKEKAPLFAKLTNNIDEALSISEDDWFLQAEKIVLKLYEILSKQKLEDSLIYLHTTWNPHFKTREQLEKGLDLLLFIYEDLMFVQIGYEKELTYPDSLQLWRQGALQISKDLLLKKISFILEAKRRLQSNVNGTLLMEQLLINLQEGFTFV